MSTSAEQGVRAHGSCATPPPPLHVIPHAPGHGVALLASQLAQAVGADRADIRDTMALRRGRVHVHVTERIFGPDPEQAAARLVHLARRHQTTVTLHDVPQPADGPAFGRRRRAYASVLASTAGWVVNSRHERILVERELQPGTPGAVIPLPVVPLTPRVRSPFSSPASVPAAKPADMRTVVGVLGWLYPGKGHAEVLAACARLRAPVVLRVLGGTSPGHEPLATELAAVARRRGVTWEATGWVPDDEMPAAMAAVDVPVAAHRNVSASGSINSWVAAGRRPLVARGVYGREMARLRPDTLTLVDVDPARLARAIDRARRDPTSTWLARGVRTRPTLRDVANAYCLWWASL